MRKLLSVLGFGLLLAGSLGQLQAQTVDRRFRADLSIGGDGTTFVHNPFNSLISQILIPGLSGEITGRVRIGNHFSIQLAPGYTLRPYRSDRSFIVDSLGAKSIPRTSPGDTVRRELRGNLHEFRLGMMFYFHFGNTQEGFHMGFGPEIQKITLQKFDMRMSQPDQEILHVSSDEVKLPMLPAVQIAAGYTWSLPQRMLFQVEPYFKYSPIFVEDGKTLSWSTVGVRGKLWL